MVCVMPHVALLIALPAAALHRSGWVNRLSTCLISMSIVAGHRQPRQKRGSSGSKGVLEVC